MSVRKLIRNSVLDILGTFAKPAAGIHILNGHRIALQNPDPRIFIGQLNKLRNYAQFIRFEQAAELIQAKEKVNEVLLAFSFDDGFEECYCQIAPVLEQFNVNAAFFICPNFIEAGNKYINDFTTQVVKTPGKLPMTWEQIKQLHNNGHIIGAHTMDHCNINTNDIEMLEYQIGECKNSIENKINAPCVHFAFPFGRLEHANPQSINIAAKYYKYIYSQSDYKNYFSFNERVINRRHFEPDWKVRHVKYFISHKKS